MGRFYMSGKRVNQACGADPLESLSIVPSNSWCEGDHTTTILYALAAIFPHPTAVLSVAMMDRSYYWTLVC
jgi:hypothetical protein